MTSNWNGMRIDLSGSKAKITPAQTRDIGTTEMKRTYEVVRVHPQYGCCYYTPCLLLDGRPTSIQGRMHQYPRTARTALKKWAKQVEIDLANATITDNGENTSYTNLPMWDYHFMYFSKGNTYPHGYEYDRMLTTTRRCSFDIRATIIKEG
jgi:hypothetical protein